MSGTVTECRGNKITVRGSRNINIHPVEVVGGGDLKANF